MNTPNRPRSGIVPPLVTASMRAPRAGLQRARRRGPTRAGVAARRTRRTDSGRRACRARPRARRRSARRRDRHRAAISATSSTVSVLDRRHGDDLLGKDVERVPGDVRLFDEARASCAARPLPPPRDRRGTSGRYDPTTARPRGGRPGRCVADRSPPTRAPRPARPSRWRPCRCRARATRWPPAREACPPSARPRCRDAARGRSTRGARAPSSLRLASSLRRAASRSASRREFTKISVERCWSDEVEQHRVDGGPDRRAVPLGHPGRPAEHEVVAGLVARRDGLAELAHVLDRHDHLQLELLAHTRVDDSDGPRPPLAPHVAARPPRKRAISSSGRCVAERPMR